MCLVHRLNFVKVVFMDSNGRGLRLWAQDTTERCHSFNGVSRQFPEGVLSGRLVSPCLGCKVSQSGSEVEVLKRS